MTRLLSITAVALALTLASAVPRPAGAQTAEAPAPVCAEFRNQRPIRRRGNRAAAAKARRVLLKRISSWARRNRVTPRIDQGFSYCQPDGRKWSCIAGARVCVNTNHPGPADFQRFLERRSL